MNIIPIINELGLLLMYDGRLKSSHDIIISAVDGFFKHWDPSTATPMEDMSGLKRGQC